MPEGERQAENSCNQPPGPEHKEVTQAEAGQEEGLSATQNQGNGSRFKLAQPVHRLLLFLSFFKKFYLFLERGEGREKRQGREKEREKNINVREKH